MAPSRRDEGSASPTAKALLIGFTVTALVLAVSASGTACSGSTEVAPGDGGGNQGGSDAGDGGIVRCQPAPTGSCSGAGLVFCGGAFCCEAAQPFYCITAGTCHATAAEAAAAGCGAACMACGSPGGAGTGDAGSDAGADAGSLDGGGSDAGHDAGTDGGVATCHPAPTGTTCNDSRWPMYCGARLCCEAAKPYYCIVSDSCYATAAEAAGAGCGPACMACVAAPPVTDGGVDGGPSDGGAPDGGLDGGGADGGGSCTAAGPGTCDDPQYPHACGGTLCCPSGHPFVCASLNKCYSSATAAAADCGATCVSCRSGSLPDGGTDGGASCTAAGPGTCSDPQYPHACGGTLCCPSSYPFVCPSLNHCYATAAGAAADCGGECIGCSSPSP